MHLSPLLLSFCSIYYAHSSQTCIGPQTPDEVARALWEKSNYTFTKRTRPNLSKFLSKDPFANASNAEPDIIKLQMKVVSVKALDRLRGEVEFKMNFAQRWNDYRLDYTSSQSCFSDDHRVGFSLDEINKIWVPDVVIGNLASDPMRIAGAFWIYPNGDIHYVQSLILKLSCYLDFKQLPKDTQKCRIVVTSWMFDKSSIIFDLLEKQSNQSDSSNEAASSLEWKVKTVDTKIITTYADLSKKANSVGVLSIDLERNSSYYMNFVVFPVIMMVIVSWSSFFIDRGAVPARVTMSIISFLTISNFLSGELKTLPQLGASEAWLLKFMQVSMIFTFYSVLEYVLCNYLYRVRKRTKGLRQLALAKKEEENALLIEQKQLEQHGAKGANLKDFFSMDENKGVTSVEEQDSALKHKTDAEESNESKSSLQDNTEPEKTIKQHMLTFDIHHKVDYVLLKKDGTLFVSDDQVEIFSRFAFPIVYISLTCFYWNQNKDSVMF